MSTSMLSRHPLGVPAGRKFSREEIAEALRLSIIAELDAVNLYLQLARAIDDEKVRKVFEDIAKEEKTHVGEFLTLLKSLDPEQVEELKRGAEEVKELTGIEVSNSISVDEKQKEKQEELEGLGGNELRYLREYLYKLADNTRVFRHYLPIVKIGRGVDAVPLERENVRIVVPLEEISRSFVITQRSIDYSRYSRQPLDIGGALNIVVQFALDEDKKILDRLLATEESLKFVASNWDEPGVAVAEVAKAVQELIRNGVTAPYIVFVSPSRYAKLVAVHERTGVMEITRLKALVKDVVPTPILSDDIVVVVSSTPAVLDIVLGGDTEIEYIGPEDGIHKFRLWETLTIRVRNPKGIAILKQKQ